MAPLNLLFELGKISMTGKYPWQRHFKVFKCDCIHLIIKTASTFKSQQNLNQLLDVTLLLALHEERNKLITSRFPLISQSFPWKQN